MDANRSRQLTAVRRFTDLTDPSAPGRLTRALQTIQDEISKDRVTLKIDRPTGLSVKVLASSLLLTWDLPDQKFWNSIWGAEIWRVDNSVDSRKAFFDNDSKRIVVPCIMATTYLDADNSSGETWLYWVRWVNLDNQLSDPSDAASGTRT